MIALIDYGAGNLTSVKKAFAALGAPLFVPGRPQDLNGASAVVVPGVGHFGATRALDREWTDAIVAGVGNGRPLLGICLGMQWLYKGSDEAPDSPGLGVLTGRCYRLAGRAAPAESASPNGVVKVPHVGWNEIDMRREAWITKGVPSGAQVYFTHSFVAPITPMTVAVTEHGEPFAAIVERGHIAGVQFHPEKSGAVGLTILRNWLEQIG